MPDYSFPGVFVEEIGMRSREIEGVPTATTAFVGCAAIGPIDKPTTVESFADYQSTFGKSSASQPLPLAVEDFFLNGGRKAVIVRARSNTRSMAGALIGNAKAQTGLHALENAEERVGLLVVPDAACLPGEDAAKVVNAAASRAEAFGGFYLADIPKIAAGKGRDAAQRWAVGLTRSRNMALYYPWLVRAAGARAKKTVRPPSAIAAGIYARVDQARGVWKTPAGQDATAVGITGLAHNVTQADAETLSAAAINPIRKMPGGGVVLWGARTFAAASDSEWKYVNVRRFSLFLERSIKDSLSWAVFEPNAEPLWAQIRLEVSAFLHTAWRAGALQGATPKDAYFVRCDATTMTQDDIDNGRVVVTIGIAPVKPAEFVIIRIGLWAAQAA